jgi:glyceraldehyde-3-phosphate dehydrogenase (NADP+) (phosphorylating)
MATFSAAKTTQLTQFTKAAGQFKNKTVAKASVSNTIEAKGKTCKVAINGFGRIGRNFLRCWHGRGKDTLLEVVAINDSGGVKQASHLVKYDSVLGTFEADVKIVDDTHMSIDGKSI